MESEGDEADATKQLLCDTRIEHRIRRGGRWIGGGGSLMEKAKDGADVGGQKSHGRARLGNAINRA